MRTIVFSAIITGLISLSVWALGNTESKIVLTESNTLTLRGEVTADSVNKLIYNLETKEKGKQVYLFLDTPGGSVDAGIRFIDVLKSSDKKVTCVVGFAASMGFAITQACPVRLILPNGIMMQHEVTLGLPPTQLPNQISFFNFIIRTVNRMDAFQSQRLQISLPEFKRLIRDDLWLDGIEAVQGKAADSISDVICAPELVKKVYIESVATMFGLIDVQWSGCPLLPVPLGIVKPSNSKEGKHILDNWLDYRTKENIEKVNTLL